MFPEKLIPLAITNLIEGKKVPVYGDGMQVRDWLYVEDHCRAIENVLQQGKPGETYCVGGLGLTEEINNLEKRKSELLEQIAEEDNEIKERKASVKHDTNTENTKKPKNKNPDCIFTGTC